ncbi:hypothetical protein Nepgr_030576 [Nepenthes gracilis]|uniref:DUF4378 domain-containing protein n=1 Tax=Nepenthes gracilis TaxID=150966 RepID=A0AAD3TGU1_NEPGR|nr:hypothetical protein Nepgr_030576 [Nepenthes gracilis]
MAAMAQKHLKELLKEDQEPFHLSTFISNKRRQLKKQPQPKAQAQLHLQMPNPVHKNSSFRTNLCRNACFFSFHDSPDLRNLPLFHFPSMVAPNIPCRSSNPPFLHVPANTAALLLEAAIRIQKSPKTQIKYSGSGLFGSVFKRLIHRNRTWKREINQTRDVNCAARNRKFSCEKTKNRDEHEICAGEKIASEICFSNEGFSRVWSDSYNGDYKSSDSNRSGSGSSEGDDECTELDELVNGGDSAFRSAPLSPFCFALRKSPSPDRRSPGFLSPAMSPARRNFEENLKNKQKSLLKFQEDEEEEQNSPISVLDHPFEGGGGEREEAENGYDLKCNHAFAQRLEENILQKVQHFEQSLEFDPIKLDIRMVEETREGEEEYKNECNSSILEDTFFKLGFHNMKSLDMKRLISHLIIEEEQGKEHLSSDQDMVIKRVRKRLESWVEVEANTIDMIVEMDLRAESNGWRNPSVQMISQAAMETEFAIFAMLVEEILEELI